MKSEGLAKCAGKFEIPRNAGKNQDFFFILALDVACICLSLVINKVIFFSLALLAWY